VPARPFRLIAQLSDPHIVAPGELCVGAVDTAHHLREAVRTVAALDPAPDLVLCTGDLVNDGQVEQYEHLRRLLAPLAMPVRLLCGNHDDRRALRQVFVDHGYLGTDGPCDYATDEVAPLRIVALDTLVPGLPSGRLSDAQLHWLYARLAEAPDRPTIIALHHPPFTTGIGHMDAMGLDPSAGDRLAELVRRHPHVERIVAGHLHRSITRRFAGSLAMTVPSCAHAVALDLEPGVRAGTWSREPPAVALHLWTAERGLVSHLRAIGDYPARRFNA
jgi:3',5'-cyclic AMP phosphodiesterase CpdA